jgi:hypothetical protein
MFKHDSRSLAREASASGFVQARFSLKWTHRELCEIPSYGNNEV